MSVRLCVISVLTFLFFGVQLCDTDGEAVHALLQGVDSEREGVGLVEQLSKQVLCIFTCTRTDTQANNMLSLKILYV